MINRTWNEIEALVEKTNRVWRSHGRWPLVLMSRGDYRTIRTGVVIVETELRLGHDKFMNCPLEHKYEGDLDLAPGDGHFWLNRNFCFFCGRPMDNAPMAPLTEDV